MAIIPTDPRKAYLGGPGSQLGDSAVCNKYATQGTPKPGYLAELALDTDIKWQAHGTADNVIFAAIYVENAAGNNGLEDAYADDDLAYVRHLVPGDVFYGVVPSAQDIDECEYLRSNGDGKFKTATGALTAGANVARFMSLDDTGGAVVADTRIRIMFIG